MVQTVSDEMTKTLVFQMRLDAADKDRLDRLAQHRSAPAATVVRMLIKEAADALPSPNDPMGQSPGDRQGHEAVLRVIEWVTTKDRKAATRERITQLGQHGLATGGFTFTDEGIRAIPRLLNELRRAEYVARRDDGYVLMPKGAGWLALERAGDFSGR